LSGEYVPKQNNTYKIAKALNVDVAVLLQWNNKHKRYIPSYRITKTVEVMEALNDDGQQAVYDHAELLKASGKYDRPAIVEDDQHIYTLGRAAAGSGYGNIDPVQTHRIIHTTEIPDHDFTLDVTGESMSPTISDGDIVFVRKNYDRLDGQIYVLDIDGETVIKRVYFDTDRITLVSDNPDWEDRTVTGYDLKQTRIEGIVVGWETPTR
jgi:phage repressor protein C with HTH and peptisase S24 domain